MTLAHYSVLCYKTRTCVHFEKMINPLLDQISAWVSLSSGESREMPQKHEQRKKPGTGSLG